MELLLTLQFTVVFASEEELQLICFNEPHLYGVSGSVVQKALSLICRYLFIVFHDVLLF